MKCRDEPAYPAIFEDATVGNEARKLYDDARRLLDEIVREKHLRARGVYGFWPANSLDDDIVLYEQSVGWASPTAQISAQKNNAPSDNCVGNGLRAVPSPSTIHSRNATEGVPYSNKTLREVTRIHALRQQWERVGQKCFYSLADFIAPADSGRLDYLGAFAVTAGHGTGELVRRFESDHDDYHAIMVKALADRLAEAFAELLHQRARTDWGYGRDENLSPEQLIAEQYRGIRPAPGYPACPDHTEKQILFDLLDAEHNAGITLTENFAMLPAASVSGLYFAHPDARYFAVDRITRVLSVSL